MVVVVVGVRGWVDVVGSWEEERGRVIICVCVWRCASGGNISQELICIMWSDSLFRPVIASQSFTAAASRATTPNQIIFPCRVRAALFRPPSSISFYYLRIKLLHVYQIVDEESSVDSAVTFMCSSSAAAVWQTQLATRWWWKWSIQQQKSRVWFRHKTGIKTEWKSGFLMMIMFVKSPNESQVAHKHLTDVSSRGSVCEWDLVDVAATSSSRYVSPT